MSNYEFAFIIEKDNPEILTKLEAIITKFEGKVISKQTLGKKQFAYKINKLDNGFYAVWQFNLNGNKIAEFKRQLTLENLLIRYLLILKK